MSCDHRRIREEANERVLPSQRDPETKDLAGVAVVRIANTEMHASRSRTKKNHKERTATQTHNLSLSLILSATHRITKVCLESV